MYLNKKFLAVIPARSGSKGIPNKNIIKVKDKPLIFYTLSEAIKSAYLDKIIVSTDDPLIAEISRQCGADVPFLRPKELAQDNSKTIDVLLHAIDELKKNNFCFDYIVLLQPTQPLRKCFHINESIESIVSSGAESLVSVSKVKDHPILIRTIDGNGYLKSILNTNSTVRRQDFPDYFKVNGAIYINLINGSLTKDTSLNDNKFAYIMEDKYNLDIDGMIDLKIFENVFL
jgi:CMP-N,N'-diacetyllegionaminic acid synthase